MELSLRRKTSVSLGLVARGGYITAPSLASGRAGSLGALLTEPPAPAAPVTTRNRAIRVIQVRA